jgi:hypothetical protein
MYNNSIVIIPGVATLPPEAWGQPARSWLQSLVSEPLGSRAQVWVYSYALLSSSTTLMQKIFNEGIDLLESLIDLPRPVSGKSCSLTLLGIDLW